MPQMTLKDFLVLHRSGRPKDAIRAQGLALLNAATPEQAEALVALMECFVADDSFTLEREGMLDDEHCYVAGFWDGPAMEGKTRDEAVLRLRDALRARKEGTMLTGRSRATLNDSPIEDLQAENAALREEVAAFKETRWAGSTDDELRLMARCIFVDSGFSWNPVSVPRDLYQAIKAELKRRKEGGG